MAPRHVSHYQPGKPAESHKQQLVNQIVHRFAAVQMVIIIHLLQNRYGCAALFYKLRFRVMAESIAFSTSADRATIYAEIAPQIESLLSVQINLISNLSTVPPFL